MEKTMNEQHAPPGLEGLVVADTEVGGVRGQEGFFHYRDYSAVELAEKRRFEHVWHLFHHGELPTEAQAAAFAHQLVERRTLPAELQAALSTVATLGKGAHPMDALRSALSLAAQTLGTRPWLDQDAAAVREQALTLCAWMPALVAGLRRARRGEPLPPPRDDLSFSAHYLYLLSGQEPSAEHERALERYWTVTLDHGFNASTFTSRVVTSTGADLGGAMVAALGALSGPLHGGAPGLVIDMLREIGTPERAAQWTRDALAHGERIMGFGHRVYRTGDPRAQLLREVARSLGGPIAELALAVEPTVLEVLQAHRPSRPLNTNVEFYAGVVLHQLGLASEILSSTFAISRSIGWAAHVAEQMAHNRLIRPRAAYVGKPPPTQVPDAA